MTNWNKNTREEGWSVVIASLPYLQAIKEEEMAGGGYYIDFTDDEISIARCIDEKVCSLSTVTFSFYIFHIFYVFNLDYSLFLSGQIHNSAHPTGLGTRVRQLKRKPSGPKPPTTIHPALSKLKPSDPAQQTSPGPVLFVETTRRWEPGPERHQPINPHETLA